MFLLRYFEYFLFLLENERLSFVESAVPLSAQIPFCQRYKATATNGITAAIGFRFVAFVLRWRFALVKNSLSNAENINLLFMSKSFFDRRGEKRSHSGAKTRLFNEAYRKMAKTEM